MTSKHARGLGLALISGLWVALTAWVALHQPDTGSKRSSPLRLLAGTGFAQEPTAQPPLWHRLRAEIDSTLGTQAPADPAAVRSAITPLGVPAWHSAGFTGKGVKVAILDSGFCGYRAALGKALPASVKVKSFRKDGLLEARASQHGILCAEVIHHIAPDVEFLFANWEPEQPESFLEAVTWAREQGAQILSCSIIMPSWSDGEGGGAVHARLAKALGTGGKASDGLFFASAGNTALRTWTGPANLDAHGWHQWTPGKTENAIRPLPGERLSVEVTNRGEARYELVVIDTTEKREVARSKSRPVEGSMVAVVRFEPSISHRYTVKLRSLDDSKGKKPDTFHLTVLGGKLGQHTRAGSIPFPSDGAEVIAVGAIDVRGRRQPYSSCGPVAGLAKPDLTAVVPFPSLWRPKQPFSGTSAASPQAAAMAALVWSRHPTWTASQVRETLRKAAQSQGTGHSGETGFGAVRLPVE